MSAEDELDIINKQLLSLLEENKDISDEDWYKSTHCAYNDTTDALEYLKGG